MASILKRTNKYIVRWRTLAGDGQWRGCPMLRAAKHLKLEIEEIPAKGRDWTPHVAREQIAVSTVTGAYVENISDRLAPSTVRRHARDLNVFERFLGERFPAEEQTIAVLSRPLLEDFASWLRKAENGLHGNARSSEAVRKMVEVAQLWWEWAEESERWEGRPDRGFRSGFKSALLGAGAQADAVDFLQGHIDEGARSRYIDGWQLPLVAVVRMIPKIGEATGNVVDLSATREQLTDAASARRPAARPPRLLPCAPGVHGVHPIFPSPSVSA